MSNQTTPAVARATVPVLALLCALVVPSAHAADTVTVGAEYHELTRGFGEWKSAFVRANQTVGTGTTFNYELVAAERFGDTGQFGSIGVQHTLSPDWYVSASAGAGASDFIFPRWTADASISRKWLRDGRLVTTLGTGATRATDGHRDTRALAAVAYYAPRAWIFEAGWRPNHSDPGGIRSNSGYVAATWGHEGRQYWIARHDVGREAYQLIGGNTALVDFPSQSTSLAWRRWWGPHCGTHVQVEHYGNPNYERNGLQLAVFCGR